MDIKIKCVLLAALFPRLTVVVTWYLGKLKIAVGAKRPSQQPNGPLGQGAGPQNQGAGSPAI